MNLYETTRQLLGSFHQNFGPTGMVIITVAAASIGKCIYNGIKASINGKNKKLSNALPTFNAGLVAAVAGTATSASKNTPYQPPSEATIAERKKLEKSFQRVLGEMNLNEGSGYFERLEHFATKLVENEPDAPMGYVNMSVACGLHPKKKKKESLEFARHAYTLLNALPEAERSEFISPTVKGLHVALVLNDKTQEAQLLQAQYPKIFELSRPSMTDMS